MSNINKTLFVFGMIFIAIVLFSNVSFAQEHNFDEAKLIIDSKTPCSQLTDDQFESLGDYFMEQMHPGELHEIMDERMGGEGSVKLKNVHIAIGKSFYCADNSMMSMPMTNMMLGRSGGMMNNYPNYYASSYNSYSITSILLNILLILLIIAVIIWLVKLLKNKGGRK